MYSCTTALALRRVDRVRCTHSPRHTARLYTAEFASHAAKRLRSCSFPSCVSLALKLVCSLVAVHDNDPFCRVRLDKRLYFAALLQILKLNSSIRKSSAVENIAIFSALSACPIFRYLKRGTIRLSILKIYRDIR